MEILTTGATIQNTIQNGLLPKGRPAICKMNCAVGFLCCRSYNCTNKRCSDSTELKPCVALMKHQRVSSQRTGKAVFYEIQMQILNRVLSLDCISKKEKEK